MSIQPSQLQVGDGTTAVLADFSAWPGANQLEEYSGAGELANGSGEIDGGALRLEYDDAGWFLSNVRGDVSEYDALEIDVRGDDGGEESDVHVQVGAVRGSLDDLADGEIGTDSSTLTVDLSSVDVDRSALQDVWLSFWQAGSGAIEVEEIRFVGDEPCGGNAESHESVGGQTVCDLNGDGHYRDVNGDGTLTNGDVTTFFENQHTPTWNERTDLFDFTEDDNVGQADVIQLFAEV